MVLLGLATIRRTDLAPLCWSRSLGRGLSKGNAKPGAMGERIIHALPVVSKVFFFAKRLNVRAPPQAYGVAKHKRREGAILVTQCLSWGLRQSQ
eukprot:9404797-Pyramimonas_sp.AAC.1